jgi:nicotinamide phosphoribosyltransferase
LDPHIGAIYGDSITYDRAQQIVQGLKDKGFASTNIVFGIGSFTYQYVTRDTFGMAMKATSGVIHNTRVTISKNPKTDNGLKKSAKGLLCVTADYGAHGVTGFTLHEDVTMYQCGTDRYFEGNGALETIFHDGYPGYTQTLAEIRERLAHS